MADAIDSLPAEIDDIPVHVLGVYDEDGGVVNPVSILDSSMEQEDVDDDNSLEVVGASNSNSSPDAGVDRPSNNVTMATTSRAAVTAATPAIGYSQTPVCCTCSSCWRKFCGGLRALWSTRQTEDTKENRELQIKITLRELVIYLLFLVVISILTFGMTSSMTYYFTDAVTGAFINVQADENDPQTTFRDIDSFGDWYSYAMGPLLDGLYAGENTDSTVTTPDGVYVLSENRLLGLPRLRQLRVRNNSCTVHLDFRDLISVCYGVYSTDNEERQPYGVGNGTAWTYHTADELGTSGRWGQLAIYDGGGYYQDLYGGNSTSWELIKYLKDNVWLDRGTRAVLIDFSLYNANVNLFCVICLLCEFPATGGAVTSWSIRTVKLLRYVSTFDYFILGCECVFVLFIFYYIVEEALEIKRNKLSYFRSFYNILDLIIIAVSICCISFSIYRSVTVNSTIHYLLDQPNEFVDLDSVSYWQIVFNSMLAITLFLVWIKMFKFINFSRTMTQLSVTMSSCAKDLAGFSLMFFIVFLSFAQLGYLVFGTEVEAYSSFDLALFSQFRILLGDFRFDELQDANRVLGPAYFVLYVFFVFFILLNMFLAIINDSYAEVKADMSRQKSEFEMIDFFKKRAGKLFEKIRMKREKSASSQDSSADTAHSRPTDYEQWRSERLHEGYTEAQIGSVLARYDIDGSRSVGRAELRKMHADLGRQKFAEKEDSDSIDLSDDDDGSSTTKSEVRGTGGRNNGRRRACGGRSGGSGGRGGVTHEEFSMLQRRVDRMEHSIGSIVSKIDAVLVKLEGIEQTKARRRETVGRLLDSIAESEGATDESKRQHMEQLVRDELERWDSESCVSGSGPFDPSPASSNSGRGSGRAPAQEFFTGSSA